MKLIPVIDLMQGQAVWARGGSRNRYAALSSKLCPDGDPLGLATRLVNDFGADTLYLADLDAIIGIGHNRPVLHTIAQRLPTLGLWVDAGLSDRGSLTRFLDSGLGRPVIGSETLTETGLLCQPETQDAVLSLDFQGPLLLGPTGLAEAPELWPRDLILMSLQRVGTTAGPDLARLARCRALAPKSRYYSAGGVRDIRDLERLQDAGAAGALLASALHDGLINAEAAAAFR